MEQYSKAIKNIREELRRYIIENNLKALVLGMSGGIDSALCAALAEPVVKELGIALIGRSIPITTNKPEEITRAKLAGEIFCTDFQELDLGDAFMQLAPWINPDHSAKPVDTATKIRLGNIKARLRMMVLYDLASKYQGLVLSTDNYTEYLLGFWTLHGDHADYGMIQNLWKTEVFKMAEWLVESFLSIGDAKRAQALRITIDAIPTDGLGISESDCDQFGVKCYDDVDSALKSWLAIKRNPNAEKEIVEKLRQNPVVDRHERSHFKRNWPIAIPRKTLNLGGIV